MLLKHLFAIAQQRVTVIGVSLFSFLGSRVIFSGERCHGFLGGSGGMIPLECLDLQFKGLLLLFTSSSAVIHQVIAGNVLRNQTYVLMIQMCQKVP